MSRPVGLDEWHKLINSIYLNQNFRSTPESVLSHLVEVAGGISHFASGKRKPGVDPRTFLAKALGWWFALCGKAGIKSVEVVLWSKFPNVCPYCCLAQHRPEKCKQASKANASIDWDHLAQLGDSNKDKRPHTLRAWQHMFQTIYPCGDQTNQQMNYFRLAEELGELSEAVRLLPITDAYFRNEAADVFAWLMAHANQADFELAGEAEWGAFLEDSLNEEYPGRCRYCGKRICACPPILSSSIGRLSREMQSKASTGMDGTKLFSLEEAIEYFRLGDQPIFVDNREIKVTLELLQDMAKTSHTILSVLEENSFVQGAMGVKLVRALSQLEALAAQQEVTQDSVDKVMAALQEMPSDAQRTVVDFLTHMTAGVWLEIVLSALRPS